jgi:hypothetical protein
MTTRRGKRMKGFLLGALVVVALLAGFFAAVGVLTILHGSACDRLNEERLSHLEPGHDTAGPGSIYVKGIGPGPPPSELIEYLEAQAAMDKAGCGR